MQCAYYFLLWFVCLVGLNASFSLFLQLLLSNQAPHQMTAVLGRPTSEIRSPEIKRNMPTSNSSAYADHASMASPCARTPRMRLLMHNIFYLSQPTPASLLAVINTFTFICRRTFIFMAARKWRFLIWMIIFRDWRGVASVSARLLRKRFSRHSREHQTCLPLVRILAGTSITVRHHFLKVPSDECA